LTAITTAVEWVIQDLAVWFGLHVVFDELRNVSAHGLRIDMPVWSTLNLVALGLVLAVFVAVFRFRLGP
jgi:chromate transporter